MRQDDNNRPIREDNTTRPQLDTNNVIQDFKTARRQTYEKTIGHEGTNPIAQENNSTIKHGDNNTIHREDNNTRI